MGRAIDMEKDIGTLKVKISRLETAFEGLASTVESMQHTAPAKKNIDLHKATKKTTKKKELIEEEA